MKNFKIFLTIIIALGLVACKDEKPAGGGESHVAEKEVIDDEANKKDLEEARRIKEEKEKKQLEIKRKKGLFSRINPLPKNKNLDEYVNIIEQVNRIKFEVTDYEEKEWDIKNLLENVKKNKVKYYFTLNELSLKHVIDGDGIILVEGKKALNMVDKHLARNDVFLSYRSVVSNHIVKTYKLNKKCTGNNVDEKIVGICKSTIEINNNLTTLATFYSHRFKQEDVLGDLYGVNSNKLMEDALAVLKRLEVKNPIVYTKEDLLTEANIAMQYATESLNLSLLSMKLEDYMQGNDDFMKMFLETRAIWHVLPKVFSKYRASLFRYNQLKDGFPAVEAVQLFNEIGKEVLSEISLLPVTNPRSYSEAYVDRIRYNYNLIGEYQGAVLKNIGGYAAIIYINLLENNVADLKSYKVAFQKIEIENKGMNGLTLEKIDSSLSKLKASDIEDYYERNSDAGNMMRIESYNLKFTPGVN